MAPDDKIPSNFSMDGANPVASTFTPTPTPASASPTPIQMFNAEDENGQYQPMILDDNGNGVPAALQIQQQMQAAQEEKKDFQAWAEAEIYEKVSKNGAVEHIETNVKMYDNKNGSGKASITIGKDAKKRTFEIPISIKDGVPSLGKAIDKDSNKTINVDAAAESMFFAPDNVIIDKRLMKVYKKFKNYFKGKPTEDKVEMLIKKFPSLTEDEAESFLQARYEEEKENYTLTKVMKHKKAIAIGIGIAGAVIALGVLAMYKPLK